MFFLFMYTINVDKWCVVAASTFKLDVRYCKSNYLGENQDRSRNCKYREFLATGL